MGTGAITAHIDVAQIVLYVFWLFFLGLIFYLRYEDQREGYPLEDEDGIRPRGLFFPPPPKTFELPHGLGTMDTNRIDTREIKLRPTATKFVGYPQEPTGDPMVDGVGAASWAERSDRPDLTFEGEPRIMPMRMLNEFEVAEGCSDPRGFTVVAGDGREVGTITDIWVDRSESIIRYYEVSLDRGEGAAPETRLIPMTLAVPRGDRQTVVVESIYARNFIQVPTVKNPEQVTLLEEDKIMAFYAGGHRYADAQRQGPFL